MMRTLLADSWGAVSFLTIVRGPSEPVSPGRAAKFFPLVGAVLGAAGAGIYLTAIRGLPDSIAALLTVAFWAAVSGVLHEDGLADVADALRAGRTRDQMLAILKDSRIGAYGALAITLSVLARWQALEHLGADPAHLMLDRSAAARVLKICIAAQAVPRAAMVALAWVSRPVGTGLGFVFSTTLTTTGAVIAIAQGVVAALICGWQPGFAILAGSYFIVRWMRAWFYRRIGGVNGDCLGAAEQILEVFILVLFTWRGFS